jgi:hypothetical protein
LVADPFFHEVLVGLYQLAWNHLDRPMLVFPALVTLTECPFPDEVSASDVFRVLTSMAVLGPSEEALLEECPNDFWSAFYECQTTLMYSYPRPLAIHLMNLLAGLREEFWRLQGIQAGPALEFQLRFAAALLDGENFDDCLQLCLNSAIEDKFCLFAQTYLMAKLCSHPCPEELMREHFLERARELIVSACHDGQWSESERPFVFTIGCHLLDSIDRAITVDIDDEVLGIIQEYRMHCYGRHADSILIVAIRDGRVHLAPEGFEDFLSDFTFKTESECDDPEPEAFSFFSAVLTDGRTADPETSAFYVRRFLEFWQEIDPGGVWLVDASDTLFHHFHQRWGTHPALQLELLMFFFATERYRPLDVRMFECGDAVMVTTLLCRLAQSLGNLEEHTQLILDGFRRLCGAFRSIPNQDQLVLAMLEHEIALTMFLCNADTVDVELIVSMRDQGLIPSNYHRRLVLAAIQKFVQDRPDADTVLREVWESVLRASFVAEQLAIELADLQPYEFDRWDSPLSSLDFAEFIEV